MATSAIARFLRARLSVNPQRFQRELRLRCGLVTARECRERRCSHWLARRSAPPAGEDTIAAETDELLAEGTLLQESRS